MSALETVKKITLSPLSWVWEWVYRLRRSGYEYGFLKRHYYKVPVLSVGNITFGGTGKTPTILWLADFMAEVGLITPPVGMNLFVLQGIANGVSLRTIAVGAMPFMGAMFVVVGLLCAFPELALWLTRHLQ